MLQGILKFGDTTASEIMTPRTEVTDIDYNTDFDRVLKVVSTAGTAACRCMKARSTM